MLKRLLAIYAAVLLAACAGDPVGSAGDPLRAEPSGDEAVAVTNTGDQPVYYRIVNPDVFALWVPCGSPAECPAIGPGETVRIAYADIGLYRPDSTKAELYWWRFTRVGENEIRIDSGIFSRTHRSIPFDRVLDVDIIQGPVARLLGLARVKFETGGSAAAGAEGDFAVGLSRTVGGRTLLAKWLPGTVTSDTDGLTLTCTATS